MFPLFSSGVAVGFFHVYICIIFFFALVGDAMPMDCQTCAIKPCFVETPIVSSETSHIKFEDLTPNHSLYDSHPETSLTVLFFSVPKNKSTTDYKIFLCIYK